MTNKLKLATTAAMLGITAALGGCANSPYLERSDLITPGAGDAVARNKAIHIINPRPRHAYRTHIHTDGERANNAMEAYRTPDAADSAEPDADTRNNNVNQEPAGLTPN